VKPLCHVKIFSEQQKEQKNKYNLEMGIQVDSVRNHIKICRPRIKKEETPHYHHTSSIQPGKELRTLNSHHEHHSYPTLLEEQW